MSLLKGNRAIKRLDWNGALWINFLDRLPLSDYAL
jgi:hypothetical protein